MQHQQSEFEASLEAMKALVTAPFIILIIVTIITAVLITATIERNNRS